jgi:glycosyltransferase involved in cell wall biosynthesis
MAAAVKKLPAYSPLLILFITLGAGIFMHVGSLRSLTAISSSPCTDDKPPHESLRATFAAPRKNVSKVVPSIVAEKKDPKTVIIKPEPVWWMEQEQDDWFERTYHEDDGTYHAVRDLSKLKHHFNPLCGTYRFNETAIPTVSVIVTSQNEVSGWISTSVHSIIARTPPNLLKEVIVIDDNGIPSRIRGKDVDEKEYQDLKKLPKVKVIQNHDREGCARSRLIGAKAATGEVLMFVDSHIEMISSTWYQHLVLPILEDPHTMSIQTIDIINDNGSREYAKVGSSYGLINDDFYFIWQGDRFGDWPSAEQPERPDNRQPYETPIGPGSLFAMRRDEFYRLGGYDEGLYVWGGENTELALKTWMCGGRIVMNPCSRVGHMFRKSPALMKKQWPPKISHELAKKTGCHFQNATDKKDWASRGNFGKITIRNNLRVMNIWVGDHPAKYAYYKKTFGTTELKPEWQQYVDELKTDPAALKQIRLKKENQCRDFEWFDKHVMMKLVGKHHPWYDQLHPKKKKDEQQQQNGDAKVEVEEVFCGRHSAGRCSLCPQGRGKAGCRGDCAWCEEMKMCMLPEELSKTCKTREDRVALAESMALFSKVNKPSKPLDESRLALLSKPLEIDYIDVTKGFKEHPHKGAKDENGKWGYVHDETALRKNPPPFKFSSMRAACKIQDIHYQMLTRKVLVDLEGHEKAEKSGRKRAKIMCVVKSCAKSHELIPYIRETWGYVLIPDWLVACINRCIIFLTLIFSVDTGKSAMVSW